MLRTQVYAEFSFFCGQKQALSTIIYRHQLRLICVRDLLLLHYSRFYSIFVVVVLDGAETHRRAVERSTTNGRICFKYQVEVPTVLEQLNQTICLRNSDPIIYSLSVWSSSSACLPARLLTSFLDCLPSGVALL